jgi:hypothetical protein
MSDNPKLATSPAALGGATCDPELLGARPDDNTDTQKLGVYVIRTDPHYWEAIERKAAVRALRTLAENNRFRGCKFQDIMEYADRLERGDVAP